MIRKLRPRSLYDVLATLAFFGVLAGGTAYAADTIFSGDIVDGEVKTRDLAAAGVTTAKLATDAVTSNRVKDNALTGADISEATLNLGAITVPAVRATSPDNPYTFDGECYHYGADVQLASATVLRFAGEDYDVGGNDADGLHTDAPDCDASTSRLTAPKAGIYLITGMARWGGEDNNCTGCEYGIRELEIRQDGSTVLARDTVPAAVVAGGFQIENHTPNQIVTTVAKLPAGGYVELLARHNHASSTVQVVDINQSHFTMTFLGRAP